MRLTDDVKIQLLTEFYQQAVVDSSVEELP